MPEKKGLHRLTTAPLVPCLNSLARVVVVRRQRNILKVQKGIGDRRANINGFGFRVRFIVGLKAGVSVTSAITLGQKCEKKKQHTLFLVVDDAQTRVSVVGIH